MDIILLTGTAECGKTTIANSIKKKLLIDHPKLRIAVASYANYVKSSASMLFGWDGKKDEKGRNLLQKWGTDIVRNQDPNFWTNSLIQLVCMAQSELDIVIIDDARFPNEIDLWKLMAKNNSDINVHTVKILRLNEDGTMYENSLTPEQRLHPSETSLDHYKMDIYVLNRHNCIDYYNNSKLVGFTASGRIIDEIFNLG